ncbi:MAG: AAA family ATPase [Chloroflexi bacterium]|nr:AAA family ATPase [Chloroflexota bacterium]
MPTAFNSDKHKINIKGLRWRCDPATLGFECTDQLTPPEGFIGQERAIQALEFGLGVDRPGFNVFVTGLTGTGRTSIIESHLDRKVALTQGIGLRTAICDWVYAYNFAHPEQPQTFRFESGKAREFATEVSSLVEALAGDLRGAFTGDAYKNESTGIRDRLAEKKQAAFRNAENFALSKNFTLQPTTSGISVIPIRDGEPLDQPAILKMSDEERKQFDDSRSEVSDIVAEAIAESQILDAAAFKEGRELDRKVAEQAVATPFKRISDQHVGHERATAFLDQLREYTLTHLQQFFARPEDETDQTGSAGQTPTILGQSSDPFLPFQINVFVDNSDTTGPPVIVEDNPTYPNLFGQIERRPVLGTYQTDHMMLRAGSIMTANGGYLVVRARDVLRYPGVWEGLKRVLRGGEIRTEDQDSLPLPALLPQGLRPEPIPVNLKVIISGDVDAYRLLSTYDEEFWEMFKVRADFDYQMENSTENVVAYTSLLCGMVQDHDIRHLTGRAAAEIVEHGARVTADQTKLSTRFGQIRDLILEADYWANQAGEELIDDEHVLMAIDQKIYRSSLASDRIRDMLIDGTIMVDLSGERVGQVNGLAVYSMGDVSFGKPSRITASAFLGSPGVVNIEREAKLSGSIHDKGVLILSGYLGNTFAREFPLSVTISVAFEQAYGGIDGDSASSTELYAILSNLSGVPIKQGIAVTGSVNQYGEVQAIGGVNEKVEGYFDLCREAGALGPEVGVMIPTANQSNLMLRHEVLDAVEAGQFAVYQVSTIDEGIGILTGVPAGNRKKDGTFHRGTINHLVSDALHEMALKVKQFGSKD